jgi:hypothetical protein
VDQSLDFMSDTLNNGRKIRILTVVDHLVVLALLLKSEFPNRCLSYTTFGHVSASRDGRKTQTGDNG